MRRRRKRKRKRKRHSWSEQASNRESAISLAVKKQWFKFSNIVQKFRPHTKGHHLLLNPVITDHNLYCEILSNLKTKGHHSLFNPDITDQSTHLVTVDGGIECEHTNGDVQGTITFIAFHSASRRPVRSFFWDTFVVVIFVVLIFFIVTLIAVISFLMRGPLLNGTPMTS